MIEFGKSLAAIAAVGLMLSVPVAAQTRSADSLPTAGPAKCIDAARLLRNSAGESLGNAPVDSTLPSCSRGFARGSKFSGGPGGGLSPALLVGVSAILAAIALAASGGNGNDSPG